MLKLSDVDFSQFAGRDEALKRIGRYHLYAPMFYRPSVYFHSRKLFCLLRAALPGVTNRLPDDFDVTKALVMALVHDDAEIITGDIQASVRPRMSHQELNDADQKEIAAIDALSKKFPKKIYGYIYKELLLEIFEKNTIISQVVKYIDRFDAYMESLHELYAGNVTFTINIVNEYGTLPLPPEFYINRFNDLEKNYPLLVDIVGDAVPFLERYEMIDDKKIVQCGRQHSLESLSQPTGNLLYDWWKEVLINHMDTEAIDELTIQKEF